MRPTPFVLPLLGLWAIGQAGCGPSDETQRIKLVPVGGTVTFNGKPLEAATVTFTPDESNDYLTPGGDVTGPEGNYKAMFRGRSGLYPGKYKVVVTKTILPTGFAKSEDDEDGRMLSEGFRDPKGSSQPSKSAATEVRGDLEGEVPPGGGTLDFDVKGKATPVPEFKDAKR